MGNIQDVSTVLICNAFVEMVHVAYSLLHFPKQIRYMTGFSVIALD